MIIKQRCFRYSKKDDEWYSGRMSGVCDNFFDKFEIPISKKVLWLSLYDEPKENRLEFKVVKAKDGFGQNFPVLAMRKGKRFFQCYDDPVLDRALKSYIGKKVYLGVEYEE